MTNNWRYSSFEEFHNNMESKKAFRSRLNRDGSISMLKVGAGSHSVSEIYHWLITTSWVKFYTVLLGVYIGITILFTIAYLSFNAQNLIGLGSADIPSRFLQLFFFSAQTLSMVGGVGIVPKGIFNNFILTTESMVGLSLLTIISGLLFARFSKQAVTLVYGKKGVIAPFKEGKALMIRLAERVEVSQLWLT